MLLSLMRRHAKSWLIKFLIGIIALVFIFYFGYSFKSNENVKIASVNAEVITRQEYSEAYNGLLRNLQKEYRSVWSDKLIKAFDLENRALEGLIEKRIISQEARRIGLVSQVFEPDQLMEEVRKKAMLLMSKGPIAIATSKRVMNKGVDLPLDAALEFEKHAFAALFGSDDQTEGMDAFLEKRIPEFTNQ